jgi:hypothetical protein
VSTVIVTKRYGVTAEVAASAQRDVANSSPQADACGVAPAGHGICAPRRTWHGFAEASSSQSYGSAATLVRFAVEQLGVSLERVPELLAQGTRTLIHGDAQAGIRAGLCHRLRGVVEVVTGDTVLVVVTLNALAPEESTLWLDMGALGMEPYDRFWVRDEITGEEYQWGQANYVRLDPAKAIAHIVNMPQIPDEARLSLLRRE